MPLTLRSLLAYLDHSPMPEEQRAEIQRRVEANPATQELMERIRTLVTQPRMASPAVETAGVLRLEQVADYLDGTMDLETTQRFENTCLKNDSALSEVAALHQILNDWIDQPTVVGEGLRQRVYDLYWQDASLAESNPTITSTPQLAAPASGTPTPTAELEEPSQPLDRQVGREAIESAARLLQVREIQPTSRSLPTTESTRSEAISNSDSVPVTERSIPRAPKHRTAVATEDSDSIPRGSWAFAVIVMVGIAILWWNQANEATWVPQWARWSVPSQFVTPEQAALTAALQDQRGQRGATDAPSPTSGRSPKIGSSATTGENVPSLSLPPGPANAVDELPSKPTRAGTPAMLAASDQEPVIRMGGIPSGGPPSGQSESSLGPAPVEANLPPLAAPSFQPTESVEALARHMMPSLTDATTDGAPSLTGSATPDVGSPESPLASSTGAPVTSSEAAAATASGDGQPSALSFAPLTIKNLPELAGDESPVGAQGQDQPAVQGSASTPSNNLVAATQGTLGGVTLGEVTLGDGRPGSNSAKAPLGLPAASLYSDPLTPPEEVSTESSEALAAESSSSDAGRWQNETLGGAMLTGPLQPKISPLPPVQSPESENGLPGDAGASIPPTEGQRLLPVPMPAPPGNYPLPALIQSNGTLPSPDVTPTSPVVPTPAPLLPRAVTQESPINASPAWAGEPTGTASRLPTVPGGTLPPAPSLPSPLSMNRPDPATAIPEVEAELPSLPGRPEVMAPATESEVAIGQPITGNSDAASGETAGTTPKSLGSSPLPTLSQPPVAEPTGAAPTAPIEWGQQIGTVVIEQANLTGGADDWVMVLPGGRSRFKVRSAQGRHWQMSFAGVSHFQIQENQGRPSVSVQRCFMLLECHAPNESVEILTPSGKIWVTALTPDAQVVVEVRPFLPMGFTANDAAPRYYLGCLGLSGRVVVEHRQREEVVFSNKWLVVKPDGNTEAFQAEVPTAIQESLLQLTSINVAPEVEQLNQIVQSDTGLETLQTLAKGQAQDLGAVEAETRSLAGLWSYSLGRMEPVFAILDDESMQDYWAMHIQAVASCLQTEKLASDNLSVAAQRYAWTSDAWSRFVGLNPQTVKRRQVAELVDDLEQPQLSRRVLAIHTLKMLTNESFDYDPTASSALNRPAIDKWREWLSASETSRLSVMPTGELVPSVPR